MNPSGTGIKSLILILNYIVQTFINDSKPRNIANISVIAYIHFIHGRRDG
jgi:hypothetical protein